MGDRYSVCFAFNTGILYDTSYARCRRNSKFKDLVDVEDFVLNGQIEAFAYAYYDKYSLKLPNVQKKHIPNIVKDINSKFYAYFGKK